MNRSTSSVTWTSRSACSIKHDASQAIASCRPIGPDVLAGLGLDVHGALRRRRAAGRGSPGSSACAGPSLGSWAWMITSQLTARHPACSIRLDDLRQQLRAVEPLPLRVGVGVVLADVAQCRRLPAGRRPPRGRRRRRRNARPARASARSGARPGSAAALAQPMRVVPDSHPHGVCSTTGARTKSGEDRSVFPASRLSRQESARFASGSVVTAKMRKKSFKVSTILTSVPMWH